MSQGIVLMCFGKPAYAYAAYNMALSIRALSPKVNIALIHDTNVTYLRSDWHELFDLTILMDESEYTNQKGIDPGKAKVGLYKHLPFKHNVWLDCDGILLKDISPLIDSLKTDGRSFISEVHGEGGIDERINYNVWARNKHIWEHFDLEKTDKYQAIQSSFAYIKKGKEATNLFKLAESKYNFPMHLLAHSWGGTMPDELIFSGALAKLKMDARIDKNVVHFGDSVMGYNEATIKENKYVLSLYGNGNGRTLTKSKFFEWYDRMIVEHSEKLGINGYSHSVIMSGKHVNK